MDFVDFSPKESGSYTLNKDSSAYNIPADYDIPVGGPPSGPSDDQPTTVDPPKSIWSIEFYQKYFDVNTDEVLTRVTWSMLPTPNVNFLQHFIQDKPDLYGPFWICVTLVFAIGISGNIADYFQAAATPHFAWKYNFHAVSLASLLIFLYAWVLPVILWGALQWSSVSEVKLRLLELICIYGYAMAIYVPMSVLWIIPVAWIQWILTFVGAFLSGLVLCLSLRPAFSQTGYTVLILLFVLHLFMAACFIRFFFHVSKNYAPIIVPSFSEQTVAPALPSAQEVQH